MHIQSINQSTNYLNFNGKKSQNKDKKVFNPTPQQTSTLKAIPLAVLMALNTGTLATDATCKASENNATVTTEVVSKSSSISKSPETISPADKKDYDYLYNMMFGITKGGQTNLKKTDKVLICHLKDVYEHNTGKRLGDAIIIQYKHSENNNKYIRLKNAGQKPEAADYPITETYLIPITNAAMNVNAYKNTILEEYGEEKCVTLESDINCFKWEKYPEPVCDIYAGSFISDKDSERYFNYNKDGWHSFHDGDDRCGMTKSIPVTLDDAKVVINFLKKNY